MAKATLAEAARESFVFAVVISILLFGFVEAESIVRYMPLPYAVTIVKLATAAGIYVSLFVIYKRNKKRNDSNNNSNA